MWVPRMTSLALLTAGLVCGYVVIQIAKMDDVPESFTQLPLSALYIVIAFTSVIAAALGTFGFATSFLVEPAGGGYFKPKHALVQRSMKILFAGQNSVGYCEASLIFGLSSVALLAFLFFMIGLPIIDLSWALDSYLAAAKLFGFVAGIAIGLAAFFIGVLWPLAFIYRYSKRAAKITVATFFVALVGGVLFALAISLGEMTSRQWVEVASIISALAGIVCVVWLSIFALKRMPFYRRVCPLLHQSANS